LAGTWTAFTAIVCLCIPAGIFAADFTAKSLGDYGNVTVMETTGNYDSKNPDGSVNSVPRETLSKEFFKTHKDEYDFLVIFSNFSFAMPEDGKASAFYMGVKNDTQGLGLPVTDNSSPYGSSGKLQGMIDMGNLAQIATDPLDPKFADTLYTLSHETMHRWGAYVKFRNSDGSLSAALLGRDGSHWSFLLDSGGSVMYGNQWQDNGNGTFTTLAPQREMKFYNPLELYLMGMLDKSKVPPMLLIENPSVDPARLPEAGVTITGTAKYVTIDDIIAANGPRIPDAASSQKTFKTAFIYITNPGTFSADAVYQIENVRNGFVTRHSILTDGRSIVEVASTPREDVPVNPGVLPPSTTPRTLPPNINEGVAWLAAKQQGDGSWVDSDPGQTMERDTAEVVLALKSFSAAQAQHILGLQWLNGHSSGNIDYLSRKIEALPGPGLEEKQRRRVGERAGLCEQCGGYGDSAEGVGCCGLRGPDRSYKGHRIFKVKTKPGRRLDRERRERDPGHGRGPCRVQCVQQELSPERFSCARRCLARH
jgi:hypothetical protein